MLQYCTKASASELPDAIREWKGSGEAVFTPGRSSSANRQTPRLTYQKEYQQDLFAELRSEDELVLLARGLGLLRIVINLLHSYDAAGNNLIVIVGADDRENNWIGEGARHTSLIEVRADEIQRWRSMLPSVGHRWLEG